MSPFRTRSLLAVLIAALALVAPASALSLELPPNAKLGTTIAPPGEPIVVEAAGDLEIVGRILTQPKGDAGSAGPDIRLLVDGLLMIADGASLRAGDGRAGLSVSGPATAIAGHGGDGGSIHIQATYVVSGNASVTPGEGGDGGDAYAIGRPDAFARGGDGGKAGIIEIQARLSGPLMTTSADGGAGGTARAEGEAGQDGMGCASQPGMPANDTGEDNPTGDGGSANATASAGECGPVDGRAGDGGDAEAYGGDGGTASDGTGGTGGFAAAIGGRGGDGQDACFDRIEAAQASGVQRAGDAGIGGTATAVGGAGGHGLNGGTGGDAFGREEGGRGGNATNPPIAYGAGGDNSRGDGSVRGGPGGIGFAGTGGGGGGAIAKGVGGNGGRHCGALPDQHVLDPVYELPALGASYVSLVLVTVCCVVARGRAARSSGQR